jgi:chromatin remodeling complex protein RSC6
MCTPTREGKIGYTTHTNTDTVYSHYTYIHNYKGKNCNKFAISKLVLFDYTLL